MTSTWPPASIWNLRRSPSDAKLTGLCGGVAQHYGIDPVLVRLGCVLLALSGGIGIVLYLAGWLLVPLAGRDSAPVDDLFGAGGRRWPREVWISLVVVATIVVFAVFGSLSPFGMAPAVILAVVWYLGARRRRGQQHQRGGPYAPPADPTSREPGVAAAAPPPPPAAAMPPSPAAPPWPQMPPPPAPGRDAYFSVPDPVGLYSEPDPAPTTAPRRGDRPAARRLRLLSLITVGLTLAGLGLAANLGVAVPLLAYLGAPLLVLGLTLVAATWVGRARGILPVTVLLGAAVLTTAAMPAPVSAIGEWSATNLAYTDVGLLPPRDRLDVGHLRVDLSRLNVKGPTAYQAEVDAGQLEIIVPPDVNVVVNYRLDAGVVRLFGEEVGAGTDLQASATSATPVDPKRPTLTLNTSLDVGTLSVHR